MSRSICEQNLMFLATPVQNLWKGVQNLQIWPLNPHHTPLGGILLSMRWDMSTSICVPNLKSLALPVPNLGRIQKFINSAHGPPPRPLLGYFLIHKMGLAKFYPYTKFEVSNFTRYKFMDFVMIMIHTADSSTCGRGTLWLCWLQENDVTRPGWFSYVKTI